ncbi:hypothetical protein CYMTET_49842 [Cymbomonas tetramitiformis]|uniref:DOMON domain-containing protein n=1 Tax=Cymbomonas tetramitiformis TaxID=36881 RepID=A0AAE0BPA6_9CHLO|nr:hypothetical protein CYMTET_49842 [Cymbomonas tetramitiformis]
MFSNTRVLSKVLISAAFLLCERGVAATKFELPDAFEGKWRGIPAWNILGPWSVNLTFDISKAENGDYLFENNLGYEGLSDDTMGWQRFYVEGSGETSGVLWYCGWLRNFLRDGGAGLAGYARLEEFVLYDAPKPNASSVTWCLNDQTNNRSKGGPWPLNNEPKCTGCDCFNWTISLLGPNELQSTLLMAGSPGHAKSKHLDVKLARVGPAPSVKIQMPGHGANFTCDFLDRDAHPIDYNRTTHSKRRSICPFKYEPNASPLPAHTSTFKNCYWLNRKVQYRLEWDVDEQNSLLHVSMSADTSAGGYVAVGFRPLGAVKGLPEMPVDLQTGAEQEFGMKGADIVLGYQGGVKNYFAYHFTGPPDEDWSLNITNASTAYENGRLTVNFTRPLVGGKLAASGVSAEYVNLLSDNGDVIWATGEMGGDNPSYHFQKRGFRFVDWKKPAPEMTPFKCQASSINEQKLEIQ